MQAARIYPLYPHQLFEKHPAVCNASLCVLAEVPLLFSQDRFHVQKRILHRASMQSIAERLRQCGQEVRYIETSELQHTGDIAVALKEWGVTHVLWSRLMNFQHSVGLHDDRSVE